MDETKNSFAEGLKSRAVALEKRFGPITSVLFSPVPFGLGGHADVATFSTKDGGTTLCTHTMTGNWGAGQVAADFDEYEFVMYLSKGSSLAPEKAGETLTKPGYGASFLQWLARASTEEAFSDGDTAGPVQDLGGLRHFLLHELATESEPFVVLGRKCGLLLCIGITQEEYDFMMQENDVDALIAKLEAAGVYPYTVTERQSVAMPNKSL